MEENISILQQIKGVFCLEMKDINTYSPLTLAFIGDSIFDLVIRSIVVCNANTSANQLHKYTSRIVKAPSQARIMNVIMEQLSEEEIQIYKRGRNAKSASSAKNASLSDYKRATGFEALIGYLYLQERYERLLELIDEGLKDEFFTEWMKDGK